MNTFKYVAKSPQVLFGEGTVAQLPDLVEKLNVKSVMVLSTPEQTETAKTVANILGTVAVSMFNGATMHTPTHITESALAQVKQSGADGVVSVGGGSTIGLGKAISVRTGLFTLVEALYADNSNPIINLMACEGVKALCEALPVLQADSQNNDARHKALYGSWLYGTCLGAVDMALHHKLCHTLGGSFNLPHAEFHVVVLPHALAFNVSSTPQVMAKLADALPESNGDAVEGINALYRRLGIALSLQKLGMPADSIDKAAEIAVSNQYQNPRPLEQEALRELIRRAWNGEQATQDL
ncbi:hypothetical protein ACHAPI_012340 [Fusarium lateritium]